MPLDAASIEDQLSQRGKRGLRCDDVGIPQRIEAQIEKRQVWQTADQFVDLQNTERKHNTCDALQMFTYFAGFGNSI